MKLIEWGPTRRPTLADLKKKFWLRLSYFSASLALVIFGDELIKEGYGINPNDFLTPGTHENLMLILLIVSVASAVKHISSKRQDNGGGGGAPKVERRE